MYHPASFASAWASLCTARSSQAQAAPGAGTPSRDGSRTKPQRGQKNHKSYDKGPRPLRGRAKGYHGWKRAGPRSCCDSHLLAARSG